MFRPDKLNPQDEVRILTTARKVDKSEITEAIHWLESLGYLVSLGETMQLTNNQYGGTDIERARDFQTALDDPKVKAIWFARGGYGSIRVFDHINWERFIEQPKWLIGFSDITIWHHLVNHFYGIQTLHTLMPITFPTSTDISKDILAKNLAGNFPSIHFEANAHNARPQNIEGEIIGGNLSILYSLLGTKIGFNTNGKILFIEEIDEYLYHIDRMFVSLKFAGKLDGLKALVVGGFTDIKDNEIPFGKSFYDIILEHTASYSYPVIFDFPAGHIADNRAIALGSMVRLEMGSEIKMNYL